MMGRATSVEHIDSIAQDLWAVGCLMYEMITSHQLFHPGSVDANAMAVNIANFHEELVRCLSCLLLYILVLVGMTLQCGFALCADCCCLV